MKKAGDILSALFDEQFLNKAQEYSTLFDSWEDITAKNGIAAAAAHSRIKDLDRGILLVETDHPGWKQILQTKQTKLLNDFRRRFPDMGISALSLMLGKSTQKETTETDCAEQEPENRSVEEPKLSEDAAQTSAIGETPVKGFDTIEDEGFKETLKSLGQSIKAREKKDKR
ncbi:MAG: DUF721 domain-containing protein [Treponema sp.]|jgi:hypothetical protein|nr:DUF721 domain-containing protein [Treponema sp.]